MQDKDIKKIEEIDRKNPYLSKTFLFKIGLTIFLTFAACIFLFFLIFRIDTIASVIGNAFSSIQPIIIGCVLAYLMNPIMKKIENLSIRLLSKKVKDDKKRKSIARVIGIICVVIIIILVISLLIKAIVPSLVASITSLIDTMPGYVSKTVEMIRQGSFGDNEIVIWASKMLQESTGKLETWVQSSLLPQAQKYIAQITAGVINVLITLLNCFIGLIVMIYILASKETFVGQSKKLLYTVFKPKKANVILHVARQADKIFGGFIIGKILDSAIVGVICYVGCLIMQIPDAILVSVIIGVTNIIPVFGPYIGAVPTFLLVAIQSPWSAVYLLIFVIILQQVDGNIIGPKIFGSSTGLSTFWVMFGILIGGGLFGFPGILLGVPTFGVIYYIIKMIVNYVLSKKKLSYKTSDYIELKKIDEKTNKIIYRENAD